MSRLDWTTGPDGFDRALYKGLVIRALPDEDPQCPFEPGGCHWPFVVPGPFHQNCFEFPQLGQGGYAISRPLHRLTDAQLLFDQHTIARIVGRTSVREMLEFFDPDDPDEVVRHCHDIGLLSDAMQCALDELPERDRYAAMAKLYKLLGCPAVYDNGVLCVATPEMVKHYGLESATPEQLTAQLEAQIELWRQWCDGEVFGFTVCRPALNDEDEDEVLDSCWGFYGYDHAKSGLEEEAISAADYHAEKCQAA